MKCPFCNDDLYILKIGVLNKNTYINLKFTYYNDNIKEYFYYDNKEFFYEIDFKSNNIYCNLNDNDIIIQYTSKNQLSNDRLHKCNKELFVKFKNNKIHRIMIDSDKYIDIYENNISYATLAWGFGLQTDTKLNDFMLNNNNDYIQKLDELIETKYSIYKMLK